MSTEAMLRRILDLERRVGLTEVIEASGTAGTVTSVGLTMPNLFSVAGSPVTGAGTLAVTLVNQSANTVLAGPTTGAAPPTVRALVAADIPSLDASKIGSGALASLRGGTGVSNAGTLTNASNTTITGGGTLGLGGFTLTVPANGTAALLEAANAYTADQSIAGRLDVTRASLPVIKATRTTTSTSGLFGTLGMAAQTSGDMTDGFGPLLVFYATDNGAIDQILATIGAVRSGADNQGDFVVRVNSANLEVIRAKTTGAVLFGKTSGLTGAGDGDFNGDVRASSFRVGSNQVLGARATGWTSPTGTASRATFATGTVTTAALAQFVYALYQDLATHGIVGA